MYLEKILKDNFHIDGSYTIDSNNDVNVEGSVRVINLDLSKSRLPVRFGKVTGNFYCHRVGLTTLEGSPREVGGDFSCFSNYLTSLDGCPKIVNGNFFCRFNDLTSLVGLPKGVKELICDKTLHNTKIYKQQMIKEKLLAQ